jgi:hypothetical protein
MSSKKVNPMKIYFTVVSGRAMSKSIEIPDEFRNIKPKVVVRPVRRKKERFAGVFMNPVRVAKISIPSRGDTHER